jgi:outer membrane immunogenic protein
MRRFALAAFAAALMGSQAIAADIPAARMAVKAPAMAPVFSWTGLYIGAHVGGAWADKDFALTGGPAIGGHTADGIIAGGQIGYNWHMPGTPWVFGIEGQFSWADLSGTHVDQRQSRQTTDINFVGTIAGRVGYALDRHLFYVKGGWGWVDEDYEDFDTVGPPPAVFGLASESRSGWMFGLGWEYAFMPNWSAKIEFNYLDLGDKTVTYGGGTGGTFQHDIEQSLSLVKVGVNYRFWGWR